MPIETMNLHVWPRCNLSCRYCYATFPGQRRSLPLHDWCLVLDHLHAEGVRRVTFSGGEPTLHPDFGRMLRHARAIGLDTSIVTNGARLDDSMLRDLDIVAVTLDSARENVLAELGRLGPKGRPYTLHVERLAERVHRAGALLKINTVVTALNVAENMTDVVVRLCPYKWKPLQFTFVAGENDDAAADLAIDAAAFAQFVERHRDGLPDRIWFAPESASVVKTTYGMIDPGGCVFQNGPEGYRVSRPVLEIGVRAAMADVGGYDREAFLARGGDKVVRRLPVVRGGAR